MSIEIFPKAFGISFAPRMESPYANIADTPPVNRGDPPAPQDAIDISVKRADRATRFEMDMETQKVVVKVVDKETNEEIRQIPDKNAQRLSNNVGAFIGKMFHGVSV
jgi:hypothetical protein